MWIINFFKELKAWRIVKKVCKENKDLLDKNGLRVDWIGRIYTVINRDPNIILGSEEDSFLLKKEQDRIAKVLVELNIMDILAYELKPLENVTQLKDSDEEEFENAYLHIFTPAWNIDKQYVTFKSVSLLILMTLILIGGIVTGILMSI